MGPIDGYNSWITSSNEVLEDTDHPLANTGMYLCPVEKRESELVVLKHSYFCLKSESVFVKKTKLKKMIREGQ